MYSLPSFGKSTVSPLAKSAHDLYGLVTELVGVLNDGAINVTVFNALKRIEVFVETNNGDLAFALGGFGGRQNSWRIRMPSRPTRITSSLSLSFSPARRQHYPWPGGIHIVGVRFLAVERVFAVFALHVLDAELRQYPVPVRGH